MSHKDQYASGWLLVFVFTITIHSLVYDPRAKTHKYQNNSSLQISSVSDSQTFNECFSRSHFLELHQSSTTRLSSLYFCRDLSSLIRTMLHHFRHTTHMPSIGENFVLTWIPPSCLLRPVNLQVTSKQGTEIYYPTFATISYKAAGPHKPQPVLNSNFYLMGQAFLDNQCHNLRCLQNDYSFPCLGRVHEDEN